MDFKVNHIWNSSSISFWSTVSSRGTHLMNEFFVSNCRCEILHSPSFQLFAASALSGNFSFLSLINKSWIMLKVTAVMSQQDIQNVQLQLFSYGHSENDKIDHIPFQSKAQIYHNATLIINMLNLASIHKEVRSFVFPEHYSIHAHTENLQVCHK